MLAQILAVLALTLGAGAATLPRMPSTGTLLEQLLGPSGSERLISAMERQADALERLVQLGEVALGLDPPTLAAAAEAAAAPAPTGAPGTVEISDGPDRTALRKIEEITIALASAMKRIPTDEEIHAELDRQEAVESEAARYAAGLGGAFGERGGFLG